MDNPTSRRHSNTSQATRSNLRGHHGTSIGLLTLPLLLKAGAAWYIVTSNCNEFICGGGATPRDPYNQDSYRSKVTGLIGFLAALKPFSLYLQTMQTHTPLPVTMNQLWKPPTLPTTLKRPSGDTATRCLYYDIFGSLYHAPQSLSMYMSRNHTLHQQTINDNHGMDNLEYSITVEYHIGHIGLLSQFNSYFSTPLATLLPKDTTYKKNGLSSSEVIINSTYFGGK